MGRRGACGEGEGQLALTLRDLWWEARFRFLDTMRKWSGFPAFRTCMRYHPYVCYVDKMVRDNEKMRESWLACRWCNSPRTVKPDSMDGRCDQCISDARETPLAIKEQDEHTAWRKTLRNGI